MHKISQDKHEKDKHHKDNQDDADLPDCIGATTPTPPYYAVIFTSRLSGNDTQGYQHMATQMVDLAQQQPGFLGIESARDGAVSNPEAPHQEIGITVSYWRDLAAIKAWKHQVDHLQAQALGNSRWYQSYRVRIAKVEREYGGSPIGNN